VTELRNVTGFAELDAALKQLPDRIAKNVLRGMVAAGAAVIRKEARDRAPQYTGSVSEGHPPPGTLKKSIFQKQIAELSNQTKQTFYVGVRTGGAARKGKAVAFYAVWVERGHVARNGTIVPAQPFMRDAFALKQDEAIAAMRSYGEERIPREIEALGFIR
jgi:HK97 gp10 family phage protein